MHMRARTQACAHMRRYSNLTAWTLKLFMDVGAIEQALAPGYYTQLLKMIAGLLLPRLKIVSPLL
jgi:hypothetical protein